MDDFITFRGDFKRKKGASDKRYKDNSKKRLLANLKKKFDTTIIGALAAFEEGVRWSNECHRFLKKTEERIEIILKKEDGGYESAPFKEDENE